MTDAAEKSRERNSPPDVRVVLMTAPSVEVGQALARTLLDARLVACVNIVPGITSIYRWQGRVEEGTEVLLVAKTASDRVAELERALARAHPYDTPEFVVLDTDFVSARYSAWVVEETR